MGFYGNIGNTTTAGFTFDKTYPNKRYMDLQATTDGVFIGRYVLIEYDIKDESVYKQLYKDINGSFFIDEICETPVSTADVKDGEIIYVLESNVAEIYQVSISDSGISFNLITNMEEEGYLKNYLIDKKYYEQLGKEFGRGYDSTVWQKVFDAEKGERYVSIAELNTVVPTFDITVDAPTINPAKPHFDPDSSNVAYKLHLQPNWGFRVKQAAEENGLSDFETSYTHSLNPPKNAGGSFTESQLQYNGEIYINKAGFDSQISTHSDESDKIELTPTGKSGALYSTHNSNKPSETKEACDIQELSIILPSIGNSVATLWDIAYGKGNLNTENQKIRNKDIKWDSTQGLRLVKENPEGNGFTYSTEDTETIAGCINSVHDLMGMIINNDIEELPEELEELERLIASVDSNKIYYINGKYYIKSKTYEYKLANGNSAYQLISLADYYEKNKYYLRNANKDYLLATEENPLEGVNYYQINPIQEHLGPPWEKGRYYYEDTTTQCYKINNNDYIEGIEYYDNNNNNFINNCIIVETNGTKIFALAKEHEQIDTVNGKAIYVGLFQTKESTKNPGIYLDYPIEKEEDLDIENLFKCFIAKYTFDIELDENNDEIKVYHIATEDKITGTFIEKPSTNYFYIAEEETITINNQEIKQKVYKKTQFDIDNYYKNYIDKKPITYYSINPDKVTGIKDFYEQGIYYILDGSDYKITNKPYDISIPYYTIQQPNSYNKFYEPDKYYYKENGEYILDTNTEMTKEEYYEYSEQYVNPNYIGDKFIPGALWNTNLNSNDFINDIYYRWEKWEFKELAGFARTLNTIHGLILRINNLIKFDDKLTRNNNTVQGCINTLNDIIARFDKLAPNQFTIVDKYGRVHSVNHSTDKWLTVTVDSEKEQNKPAPIYFEHLYPNRQDDKRLSPLNLNDDTENISDNNKDNISLETINIDETGHVKNKNTQTITLPYGYKTFVGGDNAFGETAAANTQATMTLVGDSWIEPIISTNTITYNHIGPVELKEEDITIINNQTPAFGGTFTIEDWYFDDKGHKSIGLTHTITIPKGSLNNFEATEASVITGIKMTPETGEIKQTYADIGTRKLNGYGANSGSLTISSTDTLNNGLATISNYINSLDYSDNSATQFISKIEQNDGKISVTRSNAGSLILGTETDNKTILSTDSLLNAFNKIEARIIKDENNLKTLIGDGTLNEAFDTIKEISDWLDGAENGTSVENLFNSIGNNAKAISDEKSRAEGEEGKLNNRIDKLNSSVSSQSGKYISSITIDGDELSIGETDLPQYNDTELRNRISGLEQTIITLNQTIETLQGRIEALEVHHITTTE